MNEFIWNLISSGTTDILKSIIGKSFNRLEEYFTKNKKDIFNETLSVILESNDEIKRKLELLKNGDNIHQSHSGNGDNVVGDKTVNHNYHISNQEESKKTISLSKEALKVLNEASKSQFGAISIFNGLNETIIRANNINFTEDNNPRTIAKYTSALSELKNCNFIDEGYKITEKGYQHIDNII